MGRIRLEISRHTSKLTAFLLCVSLLTGSVLPTCAAKKKKEKKDKIETVYVNADAEGETDKITVSEQLVSKTSGSLEDYSILENIKNVKGDEEFTSDSSGNLVWESVGEDIFYQGETSKKLPVSVKVSYYLDGKKISPKKLAGKSGKVRIRFDYSNDSKNTVKVKGKNVSVNTPFTVISAMILPSDSFSNIEVENGRAVSDGDRNIVIGMAMPGLADNLKLKDYDKLSDIDIPEYVEVTADTDDFELSMTATIVTTGTLNDIDLDGIDDLDDLKKDMDDLTDASTKLVEGSDKLLKGINKLDTSLQDYTKGVTKVDEGMEELKNGLTEVAGNKEAFEKGAEDLTNGIQALKNGTKTINNGIRNYTEGAASLEKGISSAASGSSALKSGAGSLSKGLEDYTKGVSQIQGGLNELNKNLSGLKTPSDAEMAAVSDASKKLTEDAMKLAAKKEEIDKLTKELAELKKNLAGLKSNLKTAADKINSTANSQAKDQIAKQTGDVEDEIRGRLKSAKSDGNQKIADAAKDASSDTKRKIKDKVEGLDLDEDDLRKVKAAIDDVSIDSGSYGSMDLDTDVSVDIKVDIDADDEIQSEIQKLSISSPDLDAEEIRSILSDMSEQAKVIKAFSTKLSGLSDQLPEFISAINKLDAGADKLAENNDQMVNGMKQLSKGINSLNDGLDKLESGAKKLTAKNNSLTGGAASLDEGADKLLTGSKKLEIAVKKVTAAADLLAAGSIKLKSGTGKLALAGSKVNSGVGKLVDGIADYNEGMIKFDEEGIQKLSDLAGEDLDTLTTQIKAVKEADKEYQSYAGIKEGAKGSVKFIIETAAIETDEE